MYWQIVLKPGQEAILGTFESRVREYTYEVFAHLDEFYQRDKKPGGTKNLDCKNLKSER